MINNVVFPSGVPRRESVIYKHVFILFQILFPFRLLWSTETGIKIIPMEKKCKKAKWLSGEPLQIAVKRRHMKSKGEKERYKHLNVEFQRIAKRDKKVFSAINAKK